MREPARYPVSPDVFDSGLIGFRASNGADMAPEVDEDIVRIVMDTFVQKLPEWQKSAVEMTLFAGMTFQEASEYLTKLRGRPTDKKTVWRWAKQGAEQLQEWLLKSPWTGAITNSKIPVDYSLGKREVAMPDWMDDGES